MASGETFYDPKTKTFLPSARCDIEQYRMLQRCSEAKDLSEWKKYRKEHRGEDIWLCGADLRHMGLKSPAYEAWRKDHEPREMTSSERMRLSASGDVLDLREAHLDGAVLTWAYLDGAVLGRAHLDGADLSWAHLDGADLRGAHLDGAVLSWALLDGANLRGGYLDGANLRWAHLDGADLASARLDGADLRWAHLDGADLRWAHLDGADLQEAHLDGADLQEAHLDGGHLWFTHLDGADLTGAHLDGAVLWFTHLDGANLGGAHLRGADFRAAAVDGTTLLWKNAIDRKTDFTGVALAAARVEPGLKQLLEYNVRRMAWEDWYGNGRWAEGFLKGLAVTGYLKRLVVQSFWWISDYGRVTWRIVLLFFLFAAYFALAYRLAPDCLMARGEVGAVQGFLHAFYFSVVTQTTLGFGDIHANPASPYGQLLLMLQVLLGYVLLGALVTRFAVLFTAGGPAGRFSPKRKKRLFRTRLYLLTHRRSWRQRVPQVLLEP